MTWTNLLRDPDGFRYRTYQTLSSGAVLKIKCTTQKAPTKCPALAYILTGTDPPKITKLENQHNHGAEVPANEVRKVEKNTLKAAALS